LLEFISFEFENDLFYRKKTTAPLDTGGITLVKGYNYDASEDGNTTSNGSGKSRIFHVLEGFLYGKNPRGNFKKTVLSTFRGTLKFRIKDDIWQFTYTPNKSVDAWSVLKNDLPHKVSHKPSDVLELLQQTVGLSRDDFNHFVSINQSSMDILIKGQPKAKKEYLESFFKIDTFYIDKFSFYNTKWKSIKDEIEIIKNDRIRLESILNAKKELAGEKWICLQIENCDEALSFIKENIRGATLEQTDLQKQIDSWTQYHLLFTELQSLDVAELKKEQDILVRTKVELEQKLKNKSILDTFLKTKFHPHQNKKPRRSTEKPKDQKPDQTLITEKEVTLSQMREKLRLKKLITPLVKEIEETSAKTLKTLEELDLIKTSSFKERSDLVDHYKILSKGGSICPTCHQPLTHILDGQTPEEKMAEIDKRVKEIIKNEKECLYQISLHAKLSKLEEQRKVLDDEFSRYPVYGVKLSEVEADVAAFKTLVSSWDKYIKEEELETKWITTYDLLVAEAKALGYPDILNENSQEELSRLAPRLNEVVLELKKFDRFDELTEVVLRQPSFADLEIKKKEITSDLSLLFSRVEALNEFKGVLRTQLSSLASLDAQAKGLEGKVERQGETESECKILELLNTFYSPNGFKVYELKRRCQKLIERANIWSLLFFQEKYTWLLSEDPEGIDFLIKPTHSPETEAYPISSLSSGEFNRAVRVLLFSQLELIPPNKDTNLLILDEIEGHLDEAGLTAFVEVVLPKLREIFPRKTIVVISHESSLQNAGVIDRMWLVERRNRKSTLSLCKGKQYG
jgi:DNA repair exonuclease SbcCD ATPase subunit